jgi:hypothetical protein
MSASIARDPLQLHLESSRVVQYYRLVITVKLPRPLNKRTAQGARLHAPRGNWKGSSSRKGSGNRSLALSHACLDEELVYNVQHRGAP